ncbi:MAG: PilX N-terminal domain-containing pilus assembly protein [Thermodesulfobacteriota bacterium]|nr:PilX N-terminal domain-containing pilus assembly protein [Thermodesulfobacteriota bacterium]
MKSKKTGFPRIKYGASLIKPGMTNLMGIMSSCVNQQKGIALVIALVMLLVLTLVGLSAVSMTNFETNISGNQRVYNLAFYTADGGVENFRGRVSAGEVFQGGGSYQVTIGGNTCNITIPTINGKWVRSDAEGTFDVYRIQSEGRAPFPSTGRVTIESIIEVLTTIQPGYN